MDQNLFIENWDSLPRKELWNLEDSGSCCESKYKDHMDWLANFSASRNNQIKTNGKMSVNDFQISPTSFV